MKIALLTNGIYPFVIGGMQKHCYYLSKFFARNKVELSVFHFVPPDAKQADNSNLYEKEELNYIRFVEVERPQSDKMPGHYLRFNKALSKKYWEEMQSQDFDFIYAKGLTAWHLLEERKNGAVMPPIGIQMHGLEMFQAQFSFVDRLKAQMLRPAFKFNILNADFIFSYGGKIKALHEDLGVPSEKIIIQHGAVDQTSVLEKISPTATAKKFLFIARYEKRKGLAPLLKVLKDIVNQYDFEFNFIGDVPEHLKVNHSNLKYWGTIRDKNKYFELLDLSDYLVVPSIAEGFPTVIVEAMCRGLAVIATDVGAIAAAVSHENGFLITPNNNSELKEALISAINEQLEITDEKKKASLEIIKRDFIWDKKVKELLNTIEQLEV